MSFIRDLKQRRLVQVTVTYVAAGWVGIEVIDSLVDNALLPGLAYTLALLWYLTGIPIAMLIGWYHGEKGNQKAPKWEVASILIVILVLSGFSATQIQQHLAEQRAIASAAEGRLDPHRVAVAYFQDSSSDTLRHVADALTEELIDALGSVRTLDVISANGVLPFRGESVAADSIARALEAGTVVAGSVREEGGELRVDVRLIDGASGAEYRRTSLDYEGEDLQAASPALAEEVARFLRSRLGEEIAVRQSERGTSSTDAWALLQQARRIRKDAAQAIRLDEGHGGASTAESLLTEADSLLRVASVLDPEWSEPVRERADLAYVRSRITHDPAARIEWVRRAVEHATDALRLNPDEPKALSIRGTARYWRWWIDDHLDEGARRELFEGARKDLERAVGRDPSRAEAYSTLTHLYYNDREHGGASAVALAAQRAYEEDAYLEVANDVLSRLFDATLDMGDFRRATEACEEGRRRFPEDGRFTVCRLRLMATPALEPDVDEAWALAARGDSLSPAQWKDYDAVEHRLFVAGALARAGLPDSATAVLDRAHARMDAHLDPEGELLTVEAAVRARIGEEDRAIELIEQYLGRHPGHPFSPATGLAWWWEPLRGNPAFERLVRLRGSH